MHSRLSIIDINKRSNQPFVIGNYSIIFNGEIYNFKELRQKLIDKKISFLTSSDTEVLLKYFIEYNEKCLDFFEGMWSFAIYNKHNGELFWLETDLVKNLCFTLKMVKTFILDLKLNI